MVIIFENSVVFDGINEELIEGVSVIVEADRIKEITTDTTAFADAYRIDCAGRILMPGLIDAHMHAYTPTFSIHNNDRIPPALMACHAAKILEGMLSRGFTSVRDAGGGDIGLSLAIDQGLIKGPRFFYSGKAISQTGGHGDTRSADHVEPCACSGYSGTLSVLADGPDEMRKAVREELRKGAHQIKLLVSGGVVSPNDPIDMQQHTEEEIRVAVYEASTRNTYVMAHCHTDKGARRCVEYGVRSIEHGSDISESTATLIADNGVFVVPTLTVMDVIQKNGEELGLPSASLSKLQGLYERALCSIEICSRAGVKVGLGADLLGHQYHPLQGRELLLRGEVNTPIEVLRSATSVNAELLQKSGELGCIAPDAYADILILNGDPLKDLSLFQHADKNIPVIMKGGTLVRNTL